MKYIIHEVLSIAALVALLCLIRVSASAEGLNAGMQYQQSANVLLGALATLFRL